MASFADELERAAQELSDAAKDLSAAADDMGHVSSRAGGPAGVAGTGGGGRGVPGTTNRNLGFGSIGKDFIGTGQAGSLGSIAAGYAGAAMMGAEMIGGAARFMTPAASAYAVTGSSQAFASSVTSSLTSAIGNTAIGGLILGGTGYQAAKDTAAAAGQGVKNITEDLARIGVNVSDEDRKNLFSIIQKQENRVTEERAKVDAIANSAEAIAASKPRGAGEGFDLVAGSVKSIEEMLRKLIG